VKEILYYRHIVYTYIYIFAYFGREVCDELKRNFYESKKDRDSITESFLKKKIFNTSFDIGCRSIASFPSQRIGTPCGAVPSTWLSYPCGHGRTVLPKCRSICRSLLLLCCFFSQAPANSSVQCLSLDNRVYTRCSFLLLHITLTA